MALRINIPMDPYYSQFISIALTDLRQEELDYLRDHDWILLRGTKYGATIWMFEGVGK